MLAADPIIVIENNAAGVIRARARYSASFVGFGGHFPGDPILPGFVHIQLALDVLSLALGRPAVPAEIIVAKFTQPILPDVNIAIAISAKGGAEGPVYACVLSVDSAIASTFELQLAQKS